MLLLSSEQYVSNLLLQRPSVVFRNLELSGSRSFALALSPQRILVLPPGTTEALRVPMSFNVGILMHWRYVDVIDNEKPIDGDLGVSK